MTTISDISNWKLTICRHQDSITVLQAITCDRHASLPACLFGLPITTIGPRALSTISWKATGEEVLITNGKDTSSSEWDNSHLFDLTLPPYLKRIDDFAFLNCTRLKTLQLHDGVEKWGGGILANCWALNRIILNRTEKQGISVSYFAEEISNELDITIHEQDLTTRLIFPEYEESDEEGFLSQAVQFSYHISGAGYPYHHCFRQKRLDLKDYDGLWRAYLGMEHEEDCALRLAWWRLRYPAELTEKAEAAYLSYLRAHTPEALRWLLAERDTAGLSFLLERTAPDRETLTDACALAREAGAAEAQAILLEEQHKRFPSGVGKCFDL